MKQSPEGLRYDTDNYKYAKADKFASQLESGKYETAERDPSYGHEAQEAEALRMKDGGCDDSCYGDKRKNMKS